MKLSVPFIPDITYAEFLAENRGNLASVYFALCSGPVLDARVRCKTVDPVLPAKPLGRLSGINAYCLLNSRFVHPDLYLDDLFLRQTLDSLEKLFSTIRIQGIVFSDLYLLQALAGTGHDLITKLEAVPGINMMIDNAPKAFFLVEAIERTGFRLPGKLILDRSLNRDFHALEKTVTGIKQAYPHIGIELMANEGCLLHCPFKLTHDAQISLSNTGLVQEKTHRISRTLGCHNTFFHHPHMFLRSPFIRPEDMGAYAGLADTIKLSGRTLGADFLRKVIAAYSRQSFDGNLLELMDASRFLAESYFIDNKKLGPDFLNTLANCTKFCKECRICHDLFMNAARKHTIILQPYKDMQ
jgi:collagenase-like PrtC family protease